MQLEALIFLLAAFVIAFPFLMTMKNCLEQISPDNRDLQPSQLWLNLIPVFNLYWMFVTASRFARSMAAEQHHRASTAASATAAKGQMTAALFIGFMVSILLGAWVWIFFAAWILALAASSTHPEAPVSQALALISLAYPAWYLWLSGSRGGMLRGGGR